MTPREALVQISALCAQGLADTGVLTGPGGPVVTTAPDTGVYPLARVEEFDFAQVGVVKEADFPAGACVAFAYDVPQGFAGKVTHKLVQIRGEFSACSVVFWESNGPNGAPIPGTRYSGAYNGSTLGGGLEFAFKPEAAGRYHFNVVVKGALRHFGVEQERP